MPRLGLYEYQRVGRRLWREGRQVLRPNVRLKVRVTLDSPTNNHALLKEKKKEKGV